MSKKIEILENTLLKLLVRRGDDLDRQNIKLSEGELGYTTDGKRLFVGDGQTEGGIVVGNKFLGTVSNINSVTDAIAGDIVYVTSERTLYARNLTNTAWEEVSVVLEPEDGTIVIDNSQISVGTLSAGNFSKDIAGNSIEIDSQGKIALSGDQILTDQINPKSVSHLKLPQSLEINNTQYEFPIGGVQNNTFLGTDASGNLSWKASDKSTSIFFNSSAAAIPVGAMVEAGALSAMPDGWLLADGSTVASSQFPDLYTAIGTIYGGTAANFVLPDESANGYVFIKALADTITNPSFKLEGNLAATEDGVAVAEGGTFSPLADEVVISTPVPGVSYNHDTAGTGQFITEATYTKFWVTASGQVGGGLSSGSSATVYGILSAPIGTTIDFFVGAGVTTANTSGNDSYISLNGTELARSEGARYRPGSFTALWSSLSGNTGSLALTDDHILGGYVLSGSLGGVDTSSGDEETVGPASFWGGHGAPGAGSANLEAGTSSPTSNGLVKFEWGI